MVFTPGAVSLTPNYLHDKLTDAGYTNIEFKDCIPGMTKLIIGMKPE